MVISRGLFKVFTTIFLCVCIVLVVRAQENSDSAWKQAEPGYVFGFPRDHGSHPEYRVEWWYYTGNLSSSDGSEYGYQLTFFRVGIDPAPTNPSSWAVRDLFMAHLAVTDVDDERHIMAERLNRSGVGWSGASTETLDVWNEDWSASLVEGVHILEAQDEVKDFGISLKLVSRQPIVFHGQNGYSQKGSDPGNASEYYSVTHLETSGNLIVDGMVHEVTGLSWMDHEFGTSFLEVNQQGWDWFSLQFTDGSALMVYVLRQIDGTVDMHSGGTFIDADGSVTVLQKDDYYLEPTRRWFSSLSGADYPVEWNIDIPELEVSLKVQALVDSQEMTTGQSTGVTYWEGAVGARGTVAEELIQGRGYLEMTGYTGPPMSEALGGKVR
tara:strand:+ start:211 stop:1356 length:1146 start_codon:yes stop_codon:yes gene_type:complete